MVRNGIELIRAEDLRLHNDARSTGTGLEICTDLLQWSYAVSFPIDVPEAPEDLQPLLVLDLHVTAGSVGVGVLDSELRHFVTSETDTTASSGPVRIELRLESSETPLNVMIRNTAAGGTASQFRLISATLTNALREGLLHTTQSPPELIVDVHRRPHVTMTLDVFVSHTSRRWFAEQCDRSYLQTRYSAAERLSSPPPFESLPRTKPRITGS